MLRNLCLLISYEGCNYLGWQKNNAGPSVEHQLQKYLLLILQEPIELQAASRTDAGVHAYGQVVNFFTSRKDICLKKLHRSLNRLLSPNISVRNLFERPPSFHPSLDSQSKIYKYQICSLPIQLPTQRFHSWHYPYPLDLVKMKEAIPFFLGQKNFAAFANKHEEVKPKNSICCVMRIEICEVGNGRFHFEIEGDRFLYKMVRNIVGTLLFVGRGKIDPKDLSSLIQSKDRRKLGVTAAAHGLSLHCIKYAELYTDQCIA